MRNEDRFNDKLVVHDFGFKASTKFTVAKHQVEKSTQRTILSNSLKYVSRKILKPYSSSFHPEKGKFVVKSGEIIGMKLEWFERASGSSWRLPSDTDCGNFLMKLETG